MRLILFFTTISILFSACKDPGSIGAVLLQDEEFLIEFTDTLTIPGKVVRGDSLVIYSNSLEKSIGVIDEPIFGETQNQLYVNTTFNTTNTLLANPDFSDATLDSVILRIPLDSDFSYGDTNAVHTVEVIQLTNSITDELELIGIDNVTSHTELPFDESMVIGDTIFIPNYSDEVPIKAHVSDDTLMFEPHLRVKLDNSFGQVFFDDPLTTETDSSYSETAKGFVIRSTPNASSFIGLDMSDPSIHSLAFYYTLNDDDETKLVYPFNLGAFSHLNVNHDYDGDGSAIEAALNDSSNDQEFLYAEGYSGTNVEFDLSALRNFEDKIINFASLEITLADVPGYDTRLYPPVNNFYLSYTNEDGDLRLIRDITSLISTGFVSLEEFYGGNPVVDGLTGETTYSMNISAFVNDLLSGELGDSNTLTLTSVSRFTEPNRSIIYGNGSGGPEPKLKLVISEP